MPAPDRMLFARPRQPAAGRRPPLSPEPAETGRPLPRVTATDDSVPPSTSAACRPTSAATWLTPTAHSRPPTDFDARRFSPRPTAGSPFPGSARTLPGGVDACGAAGPASEPSGANNRSSRYPTRDSSVPRVSDRSGPGRRRRSPAAVALGTTGPRSGRSGRERRWTTSPGSGDIAWTDSAGGRTPRPPPPAGRRALSRMPPGSARPGHRLPLPLCARAIGTGPPRCRTAARRPECWGPGACAAPAPVEGTSP